MHGSYVIIAREISGAGSSYLSVRDMDKKHLAYMALIGAFGDMQCQNRFVGVNQLILKDGQEAGNLEIHEDLKIVSKAQEPLFKSIECAVSHEVRRRGQ